ncbi:ABC-2 type transport system permease protein [Dyadobacter jejuensis]|uniref:ABC-2 type transport system permease protein n=1 Tax=Dyadobacter jejuensis TaxID=1082580 RepID=A0A316AQC4_9BACT|nr:gliding motility-associated ABC transporter permease subunit GldF [Dyadobacter jejuensis]PWJ59616.1 ABC-2 type transport system permease protein [Dyadobacter jejuensis]
MYAIFQKELSSFFNSLIAYMVMAVFLLVVGLIVWVFPDSNILDYGYADLASFFYLTPYLFLFVIPAITMRSFSEEVRMGTIELLLTKPITIWELVLGKFMANWLLVLLTIFPTLIFVYSVYQLGNPVGNLDLAAVAGGYIGLVLLSGCMVAMGIFASTLNENQIVGFVLTVLLVFFWFIGLGAIAQLFNSGFMAQLLSYMALDAQYQSVGKGLVEAGSVVYQLSLIVLFLYFTVQRVATLKR